MKTFSKITVLKITMLMSCLFCNNLCYCEIEITKNGYSNYFIVISPDAVPAEKTAAVELQRFIHILSGVKLAIKDTYISGSNKPAIFIGRSKQIAKIFDLKDFNFKPDEILIKTANNNLLLSGARPRGTLYAVYSLLEKYWNVRFYTPSVTKLPKNASLSLPDLSIRYAPNFVVRDTDYYSIEKNPIFSVRCRINGHWKKIPLSYGGNEKVLGWCHTFRQILRPSTYFDKHPEWFSEINGKRKKYGTQLCLSNIEMRKFFIKKVREKLIANPKFKVISITQNDNKNYCTCPNCQKLAQKYGNRQSGVMLDFVNSIAGELKNEFPNIAFETFAYQYTLPPPVNIKALPNVIVKVCSIDANPSQALNSNANSLFRGYLKKWGKIAKQLGAWNYTVNFSNFIRVHPTFQHMDNDLRFFADNGVKFVFEEGDPASGVLGDMIELRTYLVCRLMWNPNLSGSEIIKEFVNDYYGPGAPEIMKYITLLQDEVETHSQQKMTCFTESTAGWLTWNKLLEARSLMMQALDKVKNDKVYYNRVRKASFSIRMTLFLRLEIENSKLLQESGLSLSALRVELGDLSEIARKFHLRFYKLCGKWLFLEKIMRSKVGMIAKDQIPRPFQKVISNKIIILNPEDLNIHGSSKQVQIVTDKKSICGKAIKLSLKHKSTWSIQSTSFSKLLDGKYRLYVGMRTDTSSNAQLDFPIAEAGIYNLDQKKGITKKISIKKVNEKEYSYVDIGVFNLGAEGRKYFYCAPIRNPNMKNILVNQLVMIKE